MIPKIIHQTYIDQESIPSHWQESPASWKTNNPDWEYRFWSDRDIEQLVRDEFPDLLPLYESYRITIQRIDFARVLILYRHGGLYSDLDIVCEKPFGPLRNNNCVLFKTDFGLSNDLMLFEKGSRVLETMIDLHRRRRHVANCSLIFPHLRVMWGTGPMLLTKAAKYHRGEITTTDYGTLVSHRTGSSWHALDGKILRKLHKGSQRLINYLRKK